MTGPRPAPLRPLGVAEILDGAVRLLWRNARAALSISIPFAIVRAVAGAWVAYASVASRDAVTIGTIATLLLGVLFGVLAGGLLAPLFSSDLIGGRITARETLRRVRGRTWALVALGLVVTLGEAVGLVLLVVGGVWLWGAWAVAAPALVIERTGVRGALRRSMTLVRGTFWRVWGVRALGWLLTYVLNALFVLPFQLLAYYLSKVNPLDQTPTASHPVVYVTLITAGGLLSAAVLQPVAAAIDVVLYTDLRMRKEGMDIVLGIPPAPAPASAPAVRAW